jgi:RNA polymerase-interacting CarD/CdnL/TRCF family regulator
MHRRPNLQEAIDVLQNLSEHNVDANTTINDYNAMLAKGEIFQASRMVVDIVDHYYHLLDLKGTTNG